MSADRSIWPRLNLIILLISLDTAAYLLLTAIPIANQDPQPLLEAVYWLESAIALEGGEQAVATGVLKNAGLGHVHLIQNKVLDNAHPLPQPQDLLGSLSRVHWPQSM